mgnify:CR=1 FL=1|jgi:hypothetical protein
MLGYNVFVYCCNNPLMLNDSTGMCPYNGTVADFCRLEHGLPSIDCTCGKKTEKKPTTAAVTQGPKNSPPDHPDFKPPKRGNKKTKNPNGPETGWQARDGGVWVWTPNMHGGDGWTVQYPNGEHSHAYPGGKTRNHFQRENSLGESVTRTFVGMVGTIWLFANDASGIGVIDDACIPATAACFVSGFSKRVCSECGEESQYGF